MGGIKEYFCKTWHQFSKEQCEHLWFSGFADETITSQRQLIRGMHGWFGMTRTMLSGSVCLAGGFMAWATECENSLWHHKQGC